jgi:protein involved in polysaccharide export with SLBB domain
MIIIPEGGKIMVEGEVMRPGSIDLTRRMSMLSALAASGGITYGAKVSEVEVIREIDGRKVHLVLDLEKLASGEQEDVMLKNGDIVRIPSDSGRRLTQDTFEGLTRIINFGVGGTYNMAP